MGLKNEVTFLKYIDFNLKNALNSESNLFIMTSRIEKKSVAGFGISFIEAASYGVGDIGGKDGGASDAISHKKTGLICDGNDLNALYETLLKTLSDNHYKELGSNALAFSKNFSWDKIVKKYIELI